MLPSDDYELETQNTRISHIILAGQSHRVICNKKLLFIARVYTACERVSISPMLNEQKYADRLDAVVVCVRFANQTNVIADSPPSQ